MIKNAGRLAVIAVIAVIVVSLLSPMATSARDIRTETIHFAKGRSEATVSDRIQGYAAVDYVLRASAGQSMRVSLQSDNTAAYFNVLPPGSADVAMFVGSISGNQFSGTLPESGDYTVRVYMMRNAARRNETADYTLTVDITGAATGAAAATSHGGDANVPGTDFNATGILACARVAGQPKGSCRFGVKREAGGNGTITVFWPDGGSRVIVYENGTPMSYDQSEADSGARMTVGREGDLFMIRIGEQRFEFSEAVITGG